MDKIAERLECAWLLREAAWALKRCADRYEAACIAIGAEKQAKAEAAAQTWAERARTRLAKFTAARRKYLALTTESYFDLFLASSQDFRKRLGIPDLNIRPAPFKQLRPNNPWRSGHPAAGFKGAAKFFVRPGLVIGLESGCRCAEAVAWRPA